VVTDRATGREEVTTMKTIAKILLQAILAAVIDEAARAAKRKLKKW
jgi:hypothetical protein